MRKLIFICLVLTACGGSDQTRKLQFLLKGNESLENKSYEQGARYYREALKIDSCFSEAWNNLGTLYHVQKKYSEAIIAYSRAIECKSNYFDALLNRTNTLYESGNTQEALRDVGRMKKLKKDSTIVFFIEGLIYARQGKFDQSIESFSTVLSIDSTYTEAKLNLASALYYSGAYRKSQGIIEDILYANPDEANAHNIMAMLQSASGNYSEALRHIDLADNFSPDNAVFINNRGYIYLKLGRIDDALKDIDRAIGLDPQNGWTYRNKGLYFLEMKEYTSAIRLLERAAQSDDYVEHVYTYLGDALALAGDKTKSCESWKLEPDKMFLKDRLRQCN